jgi:hypothetical protein
MAQHQSHPSTGCKHPTGLDPTAEGRCIGPTIAIEAPSWQFVPTTTPTITGAQKSHNKKVELNKFQQFFQPAQQQMQNSTTNAAIQHRSTSSVTVASSLFGAPSAFSFPANQSQQSQQQALAANW